MSNNQFDDLMRHAKDSQCACYTCKTLRQILVTKLYAELNQTKEMLRDLKGAQSTSDGSSADGKDKVTPST